MHGGNHLGVQFLSQEAAKTTALSPAENTIRKSLVVQIVSVLSRGSVLGKTNRDVLKVRRGSLQKSLDSAAQRCPEVIVFGSGDTGSGIHGHGHYA